MIRVNQKNYDLAQQVLRAPGAPWFVDGDRGLIAVRTGEPAGRLNHDGYRATSLTRGGKKHHLVAHRVVWEYLRGPIPEGLYVNHIDGDKANNAIANLELVTHAENMGHARRTGLLDQRGVFAGERNPAAKLCADDVLRIRQRLGAGVSGSAIAREFGITPSSVSRIKMGRDWASVVATT